MWIVIIRIHIYANERIKMAILTADDLAWYADCISNPPTHKETLKASGLSKPQLYAALQAVETYSVGSYNATSLKSAIETATG